MLGPIVGPKLVAEHAEIVAESPEKQTIPSKKLTPKKYNGHEEVESDFDSPVINQEWYQADNLSEFELWSRTPNLNCGDGAPN